MRKSLPIFIKNCPHKSYTCLNLGQGAVSPEEVKRCTENFIIRAVIKNQMAFVRLES